MTIRDYDITSLASLERSLPDQQTLAELVTQLIEPESWDDSGGPGVAHEFHGRLVVQHRDDIHASVQRLLAALDEHCRPALGSVNQPLVVDLDANPRDEAIERALAGTVALAGPVELAYRGKSVGEALAALAAAHGVPLVLDERALAGVELNQWLVRTGEKSGLSLGGVLDRWLLPLDLTYTVRNRVLLVTSIEGDDHPAELRLYNVADVLRRKHKSLDVLARLVMQATSDEFGMCSTGTWADRGGAGELIPVGTSWLAVAGDLHLHHRVEDLLDQWRTGTLPLRERERQTLTSTAWWNVVEPVPGQSAENPFAAPQDIRSEGP